MQNIALPSTFVSEVEGLIDAGATITEKFRTIAHRWEEFSEAEHHAQEDLNRAILDPNSTEEEIATLRARAYAENSATPMDQATVRNSAGAHILAALRREYATVAVANYESIRAKFNKTAERFEKTLNIVDAEARPEELMSAPAKTRAAWAESPMIALELSSVLGSLHTAAILAGLTPSTGGTAPTLIGLTIDATGLHRRRVWEAWENTSGRAGKWYALWKLGATIEAPTLEDAKPYREPAPFETRAERGAIGIRQFKHDPEDDNHKRELGQKDQPQRLASEAGIKQMDYDPEASVNVY